MKTVAGKNACDGKTLVSSFPSFASGVTDSGVFLCVG